MSEDVTRTPILVFVVVLVFVAASVVCSAVATLAFYNHHGWDFIGYAVAALVLAVTATVILKAGEAP